MSEGFLTLTWATFRTPGEARHLTWPLQGSNILPWITKTANLIKNHSGFRISLLQIAPMDPFLWGGCRPPTPPGLQWGGSAPPHPSKMSAFGLRNVGLRPPWAQGPRWAPNQDSPGSYLGPGWVSEKSENENGPQRVQNGSIRAETLSI